MEEKNKKDINRRDFIKIVGISAATSTGLLYGCSSKGTTSSSSATGLHRNGLKISTQLQRGLLLQVAQQEKERCPPIK